MRTSAERNKIYIVGKVLMRAIQKCNFYWISATVLNVMSIYVKFTKTTHQIWSRQVTLASNSENFNFCLIMHQILGKVTKFGGNWLKNKKSHRQKTNWEVENTPVLTEVFQEILWQISGSHWEIPEVSQYNGEWFVSRIIFI